MLPAFLIRASIDWIRHNKSFQDSNPYSRCDELLKFVRMLWHEQFGHFESAMLEPAILIAYWEEFFNAADPLPDEIEWREGLKKHSGEHKTYERWDAWFKQEYKGVYKDNLIWKSIIISSWANSHGHTVRYASNEWRFLPSKSYLPTASIWILEPHIPVISESLERLLRDELREYAVMGFEIKNESAGVFGSIECLGFDNRLYTLYFPSHSEKDSVILDAGTMVADIVAPVANEAHRQLDPFIFLGNFVDVTALTNRAKYIFSSRRRLLQLLINNDLNHAYSQAESEGWAIDARVAVKQ